MRAAIQGTGILLTLWLLLRPFEAAAQPAPADPPPPEPTADPQPSPAPDPAGAPAPAAADPAAPPPLPEPPPPPSPIDVTVGGDRPPPGSSTLRRRDIREMPGVLADPYRAIEVKPGVTPTASGFPYFFIRGAPPGNIGYYFDGIQVPLLFHVGGGPSVIPAPLVQKVTFHPGPYPASHGRFAGAIVDATSTPPPQEWKGEAGLRLDVGALVQGPVAEKADVLVGGHYAYGAAIVSALVPNVGVGYGDYQARVGYNIAPGERIAVLGFGSYDYLAVVEDSDAGKVKTTLLDSDFHRVDLRYTKELDSGGRVLAAVTLGLDESRNVGVKSAQDYKIAARASLEKPIANGRAIVRAGLDAAVDDFRVVQCHEVAATDRCSPGGDSANNPLTEAFRKLFPSRTDVTLGAYLESEIALGAGSSLVPGLRADYYQSLGDSALAIDPKLAGRLALGKYLHLVPAIGLASQRPAFAPLPALVIGGLPGGLQRSLQSSLGLQAHLGFMEMEAAVFRQATFGLTDAIGTGRGSALDADRFLTRSFGDTIGLELGAQGALRRDLLFLVSYTLSRSTRRLDDGRVVPSAYDRTHVAQVALLYDFGRGWRGGLRHVFYSGFPADEVSEGRKPAEDPPRVKPFYRLDARLSKRWPIGKKGWISFALDLQNATLSQEVFDVTCTAKGCTPRTIGPVSIPALALEAGF